MCKRKKKPTTNVELNIDELWYLERSLIYFKDKQWDALTDKRINKLINKVKENGEKIQYV